MRISRCPPTSSRVPSGLNASAATGTRASLPTSGVCVSRRKPEARIDSRMKSHSFGMEPISSKVAVVAPAATPPCLRVAEATAYPADRNCAEQSWERSPQRLDSSLPFRPASRRTAQAGRLCYPTRLSGRGRKNFEKTHFSQLQRDEFHHPTDTDTFAAHEF